MSLHAVALPIILIALVVMHIIALHDVGSNNPDGVSIKKHKDKMAIQLMVFRSIPYFVIHDLVPIVVFLIVFCRFCSLCQRWVVTSLSLPTLKLLTH